MLYVNTDHKKVESCQQSCQKLLPMARPKKVKHFELQRFKNPSGTTSWRVTGRTIDGKRIRRNFADRTEAVQEMARYEAGYNDESSPLTYRQTRLTERQLVEAETAFSVAQGRDLASMISRLDSLTDRVAKRGVDLDTAIAFFESHYSEELKDISVYNAYHAFIDSKQDVAAKTKAHYESSLKKLLKPDPNRPVHSIQLAEIEGILGSYSNVNSRRTMRRAFSAFLNWAVRHHYCLENPCERLDKLPRDMSRIAVLSLEECKRLLSAAMQLHDGAAAPCIAIGLFAGLRPSELRDLTPGDVKANKIRVTGGKLRRKLKRSVPIPPVLATWLEKFPFEGLPTGWDGKLKLLKRLTNAENWVQDVIRHTSISFQAERDQDEGLTAYNNGTSKQMMDAHYREIIDDAQTITEFWSLSPAIVQQAGIKVTLPKRTKFSYPSKARLTKLVWQHPMVHAAESLGVSDVALRKQCVKLGIDLPPRGHWIKK